MTRVVAIVGTRTPTRRQLGEVRGFIEALKRSGDEIVVISGGADGIDQHAARVARGLGLPFEEYLPNRRDGKAAPLIRNQQIAERCTELHAFPGPESRGTWHVHGIAKRLGRTVVVHREGA